MSTLAVTLPTGQYYELPCYSTPRSLWCSNTDVLMAVKASDGYAVGLTGLKNGSATVIYADAKGMQTRLVTIASGALFGVNAIANPSGIHVTRD